MAQNNTGNPTNGNDTRQAHGTGGFAGTTGAAGTMQGSGTIQNSGTTQTGGTAQAVGTVQTDTVRPIRETTTVPPQHTEAQRFQQSRSTYQAPRTDVTVTERRTTSRPSTTAVIGSAVAAAVVGGAVPFMLAARKSRQSEGFEVRQNRQATAHSTDANFADATFDEDRSPYGNDRSPPKAGR